MSHAVEKFLLDTFQYRPDILTGDTFLRETEWVEGESDPYEERDEWEDNDSSYDDEYLDTDWSDWPEEIPEDDEDWLEGDE